MKIDLEELSLRDLRDLQVQVTKAINSYEDRRRKAALVELEETARTLGFSLSELTGLAPTRKRNAVSAAKYANPANAEETWSGRGRKPRWFVDALAAGRSPEELAI